MRKNLALISSVILIILALAAFKNEALIYLSATLMAITIVIALRYLGPNPKITRWAKANPRKAQVFITVLQLMILSTGLLVGYDLKGLGYKFSDVSALVFGTLMVIGFLSVHFLPRRSIITLPFNLKKDRVTYAGIMIAAYAMAVIVGNRVEYKYPNSMLSDVLRSVDRKIFLPNNTPNDNQYLQIAINNPLVKNVPAFAAFASLMLNEQPGNESSLSEKEEKAKLKAEKKAEKQEKRMMKRIKKLRGKFAAGSSGGSVFAIILLALAACSGVCLIIGGFSGAGAGFAVLGVLVLGLSIWGIVKVSKKRKEKPK